MAIKVRAARQGEIADIVFLAHLVGGATAAEVGLVAVQVFAVAPTPWPVVEVSHCSAGR